MSHYQESYDFDAAQERKVKQAKKLQEKADLAITKPEFDVLSWLNSSSYYNIGVSIKNGKQRVIIDWDKSESACGQTINYATFQSLLQKGMIERDLDPHGSQFDYYKITKKGIKAIK